MERSDPSTTDKKLLEDFAFRGHENSFNALMQRHKEGLFNVAFRVLYDRHAAEDVVQKVFIRLLHKKTELADVRSIQSWLYKTALHLCFDMKRTTRRRKNREEAAATSGTPKTPRDAAANAELRKELDGALSKLKDPLRVPLILRYMRGMSHVETGEIMNLSSDAIRMRLNRGLKKLRRLLQRRGLPLTILAVEEGLRSLPAEAVSVEFLASATSIIKAASTAGIAATAAETSPWIGGGLIVAAKTKIVIGLGAAVILAGTITYLATKTPDREPRLFASRSQLRIREEYEGPSSKWRRGSGVLPPPPAPEHDFLWGQVVDGQGTPMPGVLVEAGLFEGVSPTALSEKKSVQATETDSGGEFRFREENALSHASQVLASTDPWLQETLHSLLVVSREGYVAVKKKISLQSPSGPHRLVLRKSAEVNGVVVWEETMDPVAGVKVICRAPGNDADLYRSSKVECETDEQGRFSFGLLAEGAAQVKAELDEPQDSFYLAKVPEAEITLVPGKAIPNLVLAIEQGSGTVIEGRVMDSLGNPIIGAEVQLSTDKKVCEPAVSREEGRYRLIVAKIWPYQSYFVEDWPGKPEISLMGQSPWGASVLPKGGAGVLFSGSYPSSVTVKEGGERREWNPDWMPPPNAPPERLVAIHPDYEIGIVEVALLGPGQIRPGVDIILQERTKVSGKVVDDAYEPLAEAEITIEITSEANPVLIKNDNKFVREQKVISAEDGSFDIRFLREGSYRLIASHEDCARKKRELQLQPNQVVEGFDFVLPRSVEFIRGRVVNKYGAPWPHGKVYTYVFDEQHLVRKCEAEVGEDGVYEVTKLDPGKYSLWLNVSDDYPAPEGILWATPLRGVPAGTEGNDITVMELVAGSLRVHVVDQVNQPMERFDIWARPLNRTYGANAIAQDEYSGALYESPSMLRQRNRATEPGEFFLERVAPGRYSLTVSSYRHRMESQEIEIAAGQETEVTFVLEEQGDS